MTETISGHRGLEMDEPLIFELDSPGQSGVDLPAPPAVKSRLGAVKPRGAIGLPGLSEPEVVRHYTRLSRKNYAIDAGFYPLGSCTMKHNPRLNERMARLPGFADLHPLQPLATVQGALELIDTLADWLKSLTGMAAVAMTPAAGAHGEMCGMMAIRAAHDHHGGPPRKRVLVPESAHGTNPATAAALGFTVEAIPATEDGRVDLAALKAKLGFDVAAVMLTNPNTCGLFERDILAIAEAVHQAGAYLYCDGANFNAIVGRVRPADLGVDAMHINLHKTFSTPHGGGGPGSGPVVFSKALAPFVPLPQVVDDGGDFHLAEARDDDDGTALAYGRMKAFHGQIGMFVRALTYSLSHGADGLRQASADAVLSANYVLAKLKGDLNAPFEGPCMHEALFDDKSLKGTGVTTLDLAKALIDEGFHPMTVYFPLVVHGAMLIEPTESESKRAIDQFIATMKGLVARAKGGEAEWFHASPRLAPRRRLDETAAARKPVLKWVKA
ncbi:MAG: aminomethyl-transferring glycine dehydrogenase subunit GcvPB [Rhodospirillaceae bacterium]